ncbi:unnamed protein product [Lactuca virosa]|uniref:Uncharacterized protein n=1 Tax=Lactuca virosa TaxID=75947 RepID=A0AAU9PL31_9ASTR|nr:unnamed protein product [Lactuca virosa]
MTFTTTTNHLNLILHLHFLSNQILDSWPSHLIFVFTTLQGMQFMENISIEEEVESGVRKRHESEKEGFIG